jgi:hypothetical protein
VLEVNIHVEDSGAFTMPWDAVQRFRQYEAAVAKVPVERLAQLASVPEGPLVEMRIPTRTLRVRMRCQYRRRLCPISE